MGIFKHIFGDKKTQKPSGNSGKYMPEKKLPLEEVFVTNFKKNGGKFLFSESLEEALEYLNEIIKENEWLNTSALLHDKKLKPYLKNIPANKTTQVKEATYFLTSCESLIAKDGSVLFSSHQIKEFKLKELPNHFVVFATTSQIVENISEGLNKIKKEYQKKIPTNITTVKYFNLKEENNFLISTNNSKNLYLLLLDQ